MVASALVVVWDRYYLREYVSSGDFFVIDRLILIPSFLLVLGLMKGKKIISDLQQKINLPIIVRNWKPLLLIGLLFTISVYTYNVALGIEKAAVVGVFRNSAYPIAAFLGAFLFQQKISSKQWLSFSLLVVAIFLGSFTN